MNKPLILAQFCLSIISLNLTIGVGFLLEYIVGLKLPNPVEIPVVAALGFVWVLCFAFTFLVWFMDGKAK